MAKRKSSVGRINTNEIRNLLNKGAGFEVAYNLQDENPTDVKEWIPTGSRWLDSIICRGSRAGIPAGKITEIAGLEGAGKSWMAAQISANAQKMGYTVIYFDAESAIDSSLLLRLGIDLDSFIYVQATTVEFVLERIETLIANTDNKYLFVWDSVAQTACEKETVGSFDPNSQIGIKARILSLGLRKLNIPLANHGSTLLVLNQLKTNIASTPSQRMEVLTEPYVTPGGKAMNYSASLRVWLTGRKAKASFIMDGADQVGYEVQARLKKSRFGTTNRRCHFKIIFAGDVGILDEESWLDAILSSENVTQSGAWYALKYSDGTMQKFQSKSWVEKLHTDEKFKARVLEIMDEEIIKKYEEKTRIG